MARDVEWPAAICEKVSTVRWQNVSSMAFPTPTSLASATGRFFCTGAAPWDGGGQATAWAAMTPPMRSGIWWRRSRERWRSASCGGCERSGVGG